MQNHHDNLGTVPIPGSWGGQGTAGTALTGPWTFQILPYIEQSAMFALGGAPSSGGNALGVKIYVDPGRGRQPVVNNVAVTDYAMNACPFINLNNQNPAYQHGVAPNGNDVAGSGGNLNSNPRLTLVGISDGTSNTIFAGTKALSAQDYNIPDQVTCFETEGNNLRDGDVSARDSTIAGGSGKFGRPDWGGPYSSGSPFVMYDGSVRMIPFDTGGSYLGALLTSNGGEVYTGP